jgi:hypothetical protein
LSDENKALQGFKESVAIIYESSGKQKPSVETLQYWWSRIIEGEIKRKKEHLDINLYIPLNMSNLRRITDKMALRPFNVFLTDFENNFKEVRAEILQQHKNNSPKITDGSEKKPTKYDKWRWAQVSRYIEINKLGIDNGKVLTSSQYHDIFNYYCETLSNEDLKSVCKKKIQSFLAGKMRMGKQEVKESEKMKVNKISEGMRMG